uniref:hypothetical protein n=1 Tax=Algoriphagus sp. TaxID=1872435 RepID=UPI0025898CFE|nr:hypothetical protein [Algoriphagus sp.]
MITIDPVTAVLSVVLFGAFTVPFIYHFQKNKKKDNLLVQKLKDAINAIGGNLDQFESWRHKYAIGLDTQKKVLVYHQEGEIGATFCIPLSEIKKVTVIKKTRELGESKKSVLEQLGLEIHYVSPTKKSSLVEFYNEEFFSDLMGETLLVEKWAELIRTNL